MRELLERLAQNAHWIVFLLLETLAGVMLFRYNRFQHSVWLTQANTAVGQVIEWEAEAMSYIGLNRRNAELTELNIILQNENDRLRHRLMEQAADSLQASLDTIPSLEGVTLIPAQVISNSVNLPENYLTINRGSDDGVRPEMGVLSGAGLVGIVAKTSPRYAIVMSVLNSRSNISCRLRGSEFFGYLKWNGGSPLRAYIDDIPRHATFQVGDEVETSGFSSVFPPGIYVGRVARIQDSDDGLSYKLEVELSTDLARVRDVCVVVQEHEAELDTMTVKPNR